MARYGRALALVDENWAHETARYPGQVHCHEGCAACCFGTFAFSLADALLVQAAFASLDARKQADCQLRARVFAVTLGEPGLHRVDTTGEAELDRLLEPVGNLPCPFLNADQTCVIYSSRPLVCRLHGIPIKSADNQVLDPGCELNFVGMDVRALQGFELDISAFDEAEAEETALIGDILGSDPATQILLPAAILPPWYPAVPRDG